MLACVYDVLGGPPLDGADSGEDVDHDDGDESESSSVEAMPGLDVT